MCHAKLAQKFQHTILPEVTASAGISRVSKAYDIFCDLRDSNKQVVELTYTKKKTARRWLQRRLALVGSKINLLHKAILGGSVNLNLNSAIHSSA